MTTPRLDFVTCVSPAGMHRMAYWEWGDPDNDKVLLCLHGLTRCGRDFDALARRLAGEYRVVCPDVVGRGASDWLANPAFYTIPQYAADMVALIARLAPAALHWVGTSMGGLIGLAVGGGMAALSATGGGDLNARSGRPNPRINRMVLNDVGPRLDPAALARIGSYVGMPVSLPSFDAAVAYVRQVSAAGFGPHDDEQWADLTRHVFVERDGVWVKHYDLRLALAFVGADSAMAAGEQLLWHAYRSLDCPLLILRGGQSDLLTVETAREMLAANPRASLREFAGVGHAPTLIAEDQCQVVANFLLNDGQGR